MLVELIAAEQLVVVAKVTQEPAQFPQRLAGAVDPPGKDAAGELLGFEHGELNGVEGFLCVPAVLRPVDADQINSIRDLGGLGSLVQAGEAAFHATTSCFPR